MPVKRALDFTTTNPDKERKKETKRKKSSCNAYVKAKPSFIDKRQDSLSERARMN